MAKKKVSFVVGVSLDGPQIVEHEVSDFPVTGVISRKDCSGYVSSTKRHEVSRSSLEQGIDSKRTRGHSQKDVRVNHKKK